MEDVLRRLRSRKLSVRQAAELLRADRILRVGTQLKLDLRREARTGIPEVILCEGKATADVLAASAALLKAEGRAILTRVERPLRLSRLGRVAIERHPEARMVVLRSPNKRVPRTGGRVAILTAGASDRAVAAEAEVMAQELGCEVRVERDVGVASLRRLLDALEGLERWAPHAYVVLAGREGALPTVTAGLVPAPVIGVPVSTGYGRAGKGEAALDAMLQSCAPLVVVNIDAGFVAGAVAGQIANRVAERGRA